MSTNPAENELPGRTPSCPFSLYPLCPDDWIQLEGTINKVKVPVPLSGLGINLKMKHHCLLWPVRTVQWYVPMPNVRSDHRVDMPHLTYRWIKGTPS